MRKVTLVTILIVLLLVGSLALAQPPGPNGKNDYGLCKAYFAGSDTGRAHKRNAPPFQELERQAGVVGDDTQEERDEKVAEFCESATPGGR